jgi:hypothetical protein
MSKKKVITKYTHKDLVGIAEKWLLKKCGFAFKELTTLAGETPDAIGFRSGLSILIECKASRADFHADKRKFIRKQPWQGVGRIRFYLCAKGLIMPEDLPDKWGLIWVDGNGAARQKVGPKGNTWTDPNFNFTEINTKGETALMYSALRRLHLRGVIPLIYDNPYL